MNKKAKQLVALHKRSVTTLAKSEAYIYNITDDEQLLLYAQRALKQAEESLQIALEELQSQHGNGVMALIRQRLCIFVTALMRQAIVILQHLPPQLLITPILTLQLTFSAYGLYWLGFVAHAPYAVLALFLLANYALSTMLMLAKDDQIRWLCRLLMRTPELTLLVLDTIIEISTIGLLTHHPRKCFCDPIEDCRINHSPGHRLRLLVKDPFNTPPRPQPEISFKQYCQIRAYEDELRTRIYR